MKKTISYILVLAMMITTIAGLGITGVSADTAKDDILLGDFGTNDLCGWRRKNAGPTTMALSTDVTRDGGTASLKWSGFEQGKNDNYLWGPECTDLKSFDEVKTYGYINAWIYSEKATNQGINFTVNEYGTNASNKTISSNSYMQMGTTVNWSGWKLVSVKIGGVTSKDDSAMVTKTGVAVYINSGGWGTDASLTPETVLYFDKIWISETNPTVVPEQSETVLGSVADEAEDIASSTRDFTLTLSKVIKCDKDVLKGKVTVKKDGTALTENTDYTVYSEHNKIYIAFKNDLARNSKYEILLSGDLQFDDATTLGTEYKTAFTAGGAELSDVSCTIGGVSDGKLNVSASAKNATSSEIKAHLIAGVFKNDSNEMTAWNDGGEVTVAAGETENFSAEIEVDTTDGCYVRAFLWDSNEGMCPYSDYYDNGVSALSDAGASAGDGTSGGSSDKKVVTATAEQDGDSLVVKGVSKYSVLNIATVKIADPNGKMLNINQLKTEDDGSFEYKVYIGPNAETGKYTVSLNGRGTDEINVLTPYYLSAETKSTVTEGVNKDNVSDVLSTLKTYKEQLNMTDLTDAQIENLAYYLNEQKPNSGWAFDDIATAHAAADKLISDLNTKDWTDAAAFIIANNTVLLDSTCKTRYDAFVLKDSEVQTKISQNVMADKPYYTFVSFRKAFKDGYDEYINSLTSTGYRPSGGGGGGGGGGGINTFPSVSAAESDKNYDKNNDVSVDKAEKPFEDLAGFAWAEDYITSLYKSGVVSASADKTFRPGDNITRAEFIKLTIVAMGIDTDDAASDFTDVKTDDWFYPYVSAAYKMGITNGYDDGSFGANNAITRQEIAALLYRAATVCNVDIDGGLNRIAFKDGAEIADWATEAIDVLKAAGVINGDDTGCFRPADSATRAESAKMICVIKGMMD